MPLFENKRLAIDSMIVIYLLDQHPDYWQKTASVLKDCKEVIMSTLVYGEVITGFYRDKKVEAMDHFLSFVETSPNITIQSFNKNTAVLFAKLRASYPTISPPDCIHLATALEHRADMFLSNDKKLKKVKEIPVYMLADVK